MSLAKSRSADIVADIAKTNSVEGVSESGSLEPPPQGWVASALESPNLSRGSLFATSARLAARLNATIISPTETQDLLRTRQALLDKLFEGTITRSEQNKLEYVRWSLDRIEDAQKGQSLDLLETQVEAFENVVSELKKFYDQLDERSIRKSRR
ncbi:hypothetical protein CK215_04285 [Mesorhizobium sp. WSM3864]|uniref:hypothetical protein n=1 Tax=Mesorhizobium sp. WSM3864 TaxID=2029404 RepID=UPI000BB09F8E|nr:hypothetical protein [Mesorhizobium sp. WSM3864]PBB93201.1 hypothetical protein CK215_04285 [Mesorhizobium sp. WSM3864]